MLRDGVPDLVEALAGVAGAGEDGGAALAVVGGDELHRDGQLAGRDPGGLEVVAVGLRDADDVGQLEDAALDALQLIAGAGHLKHEERVRHAVDGDLRLSDADRLDQHDVESGGLEHQHRLARGAGDAAQVPRGGGGADERLIARGQLAHAGAVAEDGAAGARRAGVDGEDGDPVPALLDQLLPHGVDERRLARPGDAGDADAERVAGARCEELQQLVGLLAMGGLRRLHQGDGPRDVSAVARLDPVNQFRHAQPTHASHPIVRGRALGRRVAPRVGFL